MKNKQLMVAAISVLMVAGTAFAQAPFGGPDDVAYSKALWQSLTKANLVGRAAHMSTPYTGQHPHGAILDTIDGFIRVQGDSGVVIVKRNYGGEGVSKNAVADNPGKYLKAITVMFKRNGYDPETRDWFWVKYRPDGSLDKNPAGMMLAGKVAKGKPKGCIACHTAAPGGDFVFNSNADRYQ
jgi:hypothetical protein